MNRSTSPFFQEEIDAVDPSKRLKLVVDKNYAEFEWSYEGLEVKGGTPLACECGASELLEAMGFRWYTPNPKFWRRPKTIPTALRASRRSYWMPSNRIWLVYGHGWDDIYAEDRETLSTAFNRWATLNGMHSNAHPAGHRWNNVITKNQQFFDDNPQFLKNISANPSPAVHSFNLEGLSETEYQSLVELCAAHLLNEGLNEFNRTHFDPVDSDTNSSDTVYPFTKAVADKVRSGTKPIGAIRAQRRVPNAQLGIYAYAGHRLPPKKTVAPSVYTQVALGFNKTEYSYLELVQRHAEKSAAIMVREYLDTQAWSNGRPLVNDRTKEGYFDRYDDFVAAKVNGANCEYCANWLVNLVMCRYGVRKFKTGKYSYRRALDDLMTDVFGEDAAVRQLYGLWSNPYEGYQKWSLRRSFDFVNAMREDWYKTYFMQLMVILHEDFYLPDQLPITAQTPDDPYPAAFSRLMSHVTALRKADITHSYAWIRRKANGAVIKNYPSLRYIASPRPDWWRDAVEPTKDDFQRAYAKLQADTIRDPVLDSEDVVVVQGIIPQVSPGKPAEQFYCEGLARYVFVGPGEVTLIDKTRKDAATTSTFGGGLHRLVVNGKYLARNRGGLLFLDGFPGVRKDPDFGGNHWLYIPKRFAGRVDIEAVARIRILDAQGKTDILPRTSANYVSPTNLGPGQVAIDNINTRGYFSINNANRYISMTPMIALLPRTIVDEEFLNHVHLKIQPTP